MREGAKLNAIRSGVLGDDEYRVLNVPRCCLIFPDQVPYTGGVASNVTGSSTLYDSDNMAGTTFITCKTPGLYLSTAMSVWAGGGVAAIWTRIIANNNPSAIVATTTENRDESAWGAHFALAGMWVANAGDTISLYQSSNININLTNQVLTATLVSTL